MPYFYIVYKIWKQHIYFILQIIVDKKTEVVQTEVGVLGYIDCGCVICIFGSRKVAVQMADFF
ncbi:MAG: hypothetical protein KA530_02965 [Ferruginibacter sp.]|nr:hypothetical protein [Ferruginibacter sp.]